MGRAGRPVVESAMVRLALMVSLPLLTCAAHAGTIVGEVNWSGATPEPVMLEVNKNPEHCGEKSRPSPRLVVSGSKDVRNAVLWVEGVKNASKVAPRQVTLDQKGCTYVPHVQIAPVGSTLFVTNSDPILHNVHGYLSTGSGERTAFNLAQPRQGLTFKKELKQEGVIRLKCDAGHIWMSGYIFVVDHPYYDVSDENGKFRIDNVPPGKYKLKMWHEGWKLEKTEKKGDKATGYVWDNPVLLEKEVTVPDEGKAKVNFTLSGR